MTCGATGRTCERRGGRARGLFRRNAAIAVGGILLVILSEDVVEFRMAGMHGLRPLEECLGRHGKELTHARRAVAVEDRSLAVVAVVR